MKKYTFRRLGGEIVTVTADTEEEAREKCMTIAWGPTPQNIGLHPTITIQKWHGHGLDLMGIKP